MEFVNKLTAKQIKEFIETTFNVKVKRIVLKDLNTSRASCYVKVDGFDKFFFSFADFKFDFPYTKFGANDKASEIKKQWFSYLIKVFGKDYAIKLHKSIEQTIEMEKQFTIAKIDMTKAQSQSKQNSLQTKIDLLTTAIKSTQEQEKTDVEKIKQEATQKLQNLRALQSIAEQGIEK